MEEENHISLKLRHLFLIDFKTNFRKFEYHLSLIVSNPPVLGISDRRESDSIQRFIESGEHLEKICYQLAHFSFRYANTIQAIADGNLTPEVPDFDDFDFG